MVRIRTQWFVFVVLASLVLALTGLPGAVKAERLESKRAPAVYRTRRQRSLAALCRPGAQRAACRDLGLMRS